MKLICTVTLLLASFGLTSQELSLGYFSQFGFQPGGKLSYVHPIGESQLYLSSQVGFFSRVGNNKNWILNLESGKKFVKNDKQGYSVVSASVGYWRQSEELGFSLDLGSGNTTSKDYETRNYVFPALNYEYGLQYEKWSYFIKTSLGFRYGNQIETMVIFVELGGKIKL